MTARTLLSTVAAAALLSLPLSVTTAHAATPAKPAKPAMHKPMKPVKGMKPAARPRDAGSSAVDALNEQSLAQARGGATPAAAPMPMPAR